MKIINLRQPVLRSFSRVGGFGPQVKKLNKLILILLLLFPAKTYAASFDEELDTKREALNQQLLAEPNHNLKLGIIRTFIAEVSGLIQTKSGELKTADPSFTLKDNLFDQVFQHIKTTKEDYEITNPGLKLKNLVNFVPLATSINDLKNIMERLDVRIMDKTDFKNFKTAFEREMKVKIRVIITPPPAPPLPVLAPPAPVTVTTPTAPTTTTPTTPPVSVTVATAPTTAASVLSYARHKARHPIAIGFYVSLLYWMVAVTSSNPPPNLGFSSPSFLIAETIAGTTIGTASFGVQKLWNYFHSTQSNS